jgi:hypothetical protein
MAADCYGIEVNLNQDQLVITQSTLGGIITETYISKNESKGVARAVDRLFSIISKLANN